MTNNFKLDLSIISKELRLLFEIIKTENENSIGAFKKELFTDVDWENFLQLAMHHRVYPLIYSKLKKIDKKLIPLYVIQTLYQEYKKNTFQMLHLTGEMEQISKVFTENQISNLFLKGPVIAFDIYGDISLRTSKDLDILIPITKLEIAEELLLNSGYKREKETFVLNELKWRGHHISYFHPQKNIQLEIHWRLHPRPTNEPSFDKLWDRKRQSALTTNPVYFLGKEDLFLYLVSHGARHGWFRLRWLMDIDQMLRKGLDLEKTNILLKKYRCTHLGGQALILASQLLTTPINNKLKFLTNERLSNELAQKAISFIKEMAPLHVIASTNYYRSYLFSLNASKLQKIVHFMLLFYPSSTDTKTLRLPKALHFLYFPLHPFLWVWGKTRKYS